MNTIALLETALAWADAGQHTALAVVLRTYGSAPRPVGSLMVVAEDHRFEGSVSGGCIENEVITRALRAAAPEEITFTVADETALEQGLPCGGEITVLVTPLADIQAALKTAKTRLEQGQKTELTVGEHAITLIPPKRLMLIGAVHIAQALAPMAQIAGFEVTVIDPRSAYATPARFPGVALDRRWPDEALAALAPNSATAIVTLSHDAKFDVPALKAALETPAFYIGALGSQRTQARRRAALAERGATGLHRIHGPVGLDIGAKTPAEIAAAILADITAAIRAPKGEGVVATLLLAAGAGSRMGGNKLARKLHGVPIGHHTARAALAAALGPVFAITQPGDDVFEGLYGVQAIPNPDHGEGMASSIRAGVRAAMRHSEHVRGVLILPADKPHISWRSLQAIADAGSDTPIRAAFKATPGHPAFVPASHFEDLLALQGDKGARDWDWQLLPLDDPAIIEDVDTPEALSQLEQTWQKAL